MWKALKCPETYVFSTTDPWYRRLMCNVFAHTAAFFSNRAVVAVAATVLLKIKMYPSMWHAAFKAACCDRGRCDQLIADLADSPQLDILLRLVLVGRPVVVALAAVSFRLCKAVQITKEFSSIPFDITRFINLVSINWLQFAQWCMWKAYFLFEPSRLPDHVFETSFWWAWDLIFTWFCFSADCNTETSCLLWLQLLWLTANDNHLYQTNTM